MFDYAFYNQKLLSNESIVVHHKHHPVNSEEVVNKFKQHFKVVGAEDFRDALKSLETENVDAVYIPKHGRNDGAAFPCCKNLIHAVFTADVKEKHGDRYACVSHWLSQEFGGLVPAVPHMIDLPDLYGNLRIEYGIPKDAVIFGRTGGLDTWDIPWVRASVVGAVKTNSKVWFLLQNTPVFCHHPRIIHIHTSVDASFKTRFINSCDAMIHARKQGESFGLACGEFSSRNKPVITWGGSPEKSHLSILGNKAIIYFNQNDLKSILTDSFVLNHPTPADGWNAYEDYTPEKIMPVFQKEFLQ